MKLLIIKLKKKRDKYNNKKKQKQKINQNKKLNFRRKDIKTHKIKMT